MNASLESAHPASDAREHALRLREEKLHFTLETARLGAWELHLPTEDLLASQTCRANFGVSPEAPFTYQLLCELIHPADRDRMTEAVRESVATRSEYDIEYRIVTPAGELRWVAVRGRPTYTADGTPLQMIGVSQDVTERKRAEESLRAAKERAETMAAAAAEGAERFRLVAETVSLQVWTATPDGLLNWVNHYVAAYFGTADVENDVLGTAWTRLVHPDDLPLAGERWGHSIATGERYEVEFRLLRGDGAYRWFLVRAEAMRDSTGAILKWFGTNTEVHELKLAQQKAEAASRAKDDFLAALSHELRTPLTPVLMTATALREDHRLPPDVREQLSMMERNIGLEARLIDDLLDLTRIATGKLHLREEPCDAHHLLHLALEIVRGEASSKPVTLDLHLAGRRTALRGDPSRLQQVFWNLLRNAIKFTPAGGRVTLRTHDSPDGALHIEVVDTGIGLSPDSLESIFQPFEQAGREGVHRFGGLGLGLAIARAIVDLHRGTIRAFSDGLGRGATFALAFPGASLAPNAAQEPSAVPETPPSPDAAQASPKPALRLLLVDDHEPTLTVLRRLLLRGGYQVTTAGSVATAVEAARAAAFDVVISDLGLPDGSGLEVMTTLRGLQPGLVGIALSGYGMEEDMRRTLEAGFSTHLVKPVDLDLLRRALHDLVLPSGP